MSTLTCAGVSLVIAIALSGCDDSSQGSATPSSTTTSPTLAPVAVPAASCPASHRYPLTLQPETPDEARIAGHFIACTNGQAGTSTYYENRDATAVWTLDQPAISISLDLKVQVFRDALPDTLKRRTLEPGQNATINLAPNKIRLSLDPQVQSAWQTLTALADTVYDAAGTRLKRMLAAGSKSRRAAIDCVSEGFNIGQTIAETSDSSAPETLIESGLDVLDSAKTCGKSLKAARIEGVVTPEELSRSLKSSTWRTSTNTILKVVKLARGLHI